MDKWLESLRDVGWTSVAITIGIRIAGALLLLVIGVRVARWIAGLAERGMVRARVEATTALFLRKVAYVILLIVVVLTAMTVVGISMTPFVAVLGAAGLAIGLALKDSLSNIASGVMLVTLKPFRVGNMVDIAGETGKVESISIFQTCLRGADNQLIVLPNSLITKESIINLTPDTKRRIELVIGIGYDDDIATARAAALEVMRADSRVLNEPVPDVLVYALADYSVNLGIRCHVGNADYFATKCELTERIKLAFDHIGVSIPSPQPAVNIQLPREALEGNRSELPGAGQRQLASDARQDAGTCDPGAPSSRAID